MTTSPDSPTHAATRFTLFTAISKIHDPATLGALVESYAGPMRALGAEPWDPALGPPTSPPVVFVATGGTEQLILQNARFDASEPAVLVAHPGHNSLPASLEVLARLQQLGIRGRIHYLRGPDDAEAWADLATTLHARAVRRALLASRIGLVGEPSDWLVASSPASATVRSVWGPTVVPLALDSLLREQGAVRRGCEKDLSDLQPLHPSQLGRGRHQEYGIEVGVFSNDDAIHGSVFPHRGLHGGLIC